MGTVWYQEIIFAPHTFGKVKVRGTVAAAKALMTFFIIPAEVLPSIPSCALN